MAIKTLSTRDKLLLSRDLVGIGTDLGNTLINTQNLRVKAEEKLINADLADVDAREAVRIGQENAQIVNVERYKTKGKQLSYFAGTGFAAGSGSYADTLANTDAEYYKTMAAIRYGAEAAKNAKIFEADMSRIQSNYMRKIAKIRQTSGMIKGALNAISAVAMTQVSTGTTKPDATSGLDSADKAFLKNFE